MKSKQTKTKHIAFVGIAATLALLLSYVEFLLPPLFAAVPGIKIGLPNVVILFMLYRAGFRYAALISFIRLSISSLLFGNAMTLVYSTAGALLSLLIMGILKKTDKFSAVGVSVAGGVMHNLGQVLMAILLLGTDQLIFFMAVLMITGLAFGAATGVCANLVMKHLKFLKKKI